MNTFTLNHKNIEIIATPVKSGWFVSFRIQGRARAGIGFATRKAAFDWAKAQIGAQA